MRHRLSVAALTIAVALSACASDGDDSTAAPSSGTAAETTVADTDGTTSDNDEDTTTRAGLELSDSAPDGADIAIDAIGTTTDRPIQRGGQAAIEQGQTFAVEDDTVLTTVSFHVVAPAGVPAGQSVELTLYQVGNTATMVPSGPVEIDGASGPLPFALPDQIVADTPTHLVFSLPDVALSAGLYAVVLSIGDGAGPTEMFVQHPGGDVYADGVAVSLEGEFWKSNTNGDDSAVTLTFGS